MRWCAMRLAAAMAEATSRMIEASYGHDRMAEDVIAVMDAAGLGAVHLVGYSHGRLYRHPAAGTLPRPGAQPVAGGAWERIICRARAFRPKAPAR